MTDTEVRTFRGATMRESLARVRDAFGPDAVILATRQLSEKRGFGHRGSFVEITASRPMDLPVKAPPTIFKEPTPPAPEEKPRTPTDAHAETNALTIDVSPHAERLRARLEALEFPVDILQECLAVATHPLSRHLLLDDAKLMEHLGEYLASRIKTKPGFGDGTKSLLLVGPTGGGKTTVAAKMAAREVVAGLRPVCLATVDDHRIGSPTELERYAAILGARFFQARSAEELVDRINDGPLDELVLVDSPGANPFTRCAIQDLKLWAPLTSRVALVIPVTVRDTFLRVALDAFSQLDYEHLILTKLDETASPGAILSVASMSSVPIAVVSMGQDICRDLSPSDSRTLARWVLKGYSRDSATGGEGECSAPAA